MQSKSFKKLVMVVVVAAMLTLGVGAVAFGYGAADFQPQGNMVVTAVSAKNSINTVSNSFVTVPALDTTVVVPTNKVADIVIQFSGVVNSADYLYTQARIDGVAINPGPTQLFDGTDNTGAYAHGFNYYKFNVGPGRHRIDIQWKGLGGNQFMAERSMVIFASIRNP